MKITNTPEMCGGERRKFLGAVVALVMTAGCATKGTQFDWAEVDKLVAGKSTRAEAVALIGKPYAESFYADGSSLVQWIFIRASAFQSSSGHVAILFDKDGVMKRITDRSGR